MAPPLLLPVILAALVLPDHVGGPGPQRLALGVGVEDGVPALDVRIGVLSALAVNLEAFWHPEAPLLGGGLRGAAGRTRSGRMFASVWTEAHVRPVLTTDLTQSVAGSDLAVGLGLTLRWGWGALGLDGGAAVGFPVADVEISGLDGDTMDQQGGFFATQRLTVALDLGDHLELALRGLFALPVDSIELDRRNQDVIGTWDFQLGARVLLRF